MIISEIEIKRNAEKFGLNEKKFSFVEKKIFLRKKYYLIYKPHEFFFEIDKDKNDLNNYFPYFCQKDDFSNIQNWFCSIKNTLIKSNKIVKDLKDSKTLRDQFKKKYKI